ncbi:MAG TPA: hypothetical protein PLI45_00460 [Candidatus Woesebacteria bacterium]|nr:hypothetical protein [Candidatus Woesebacteria bacterium]
MTYIVFVWDRITYHVKRTSHDPIILPNGEIITIKDWDIDCNPIQGFGPKYIANLCMFDNTNLDSVASQLHGVLAIPINLEITYDCPKGCQKPTTPYCNKCGSKVETNIKVSDLPFTPRSRYDKKMMSTKDWRCPNCNKQLSQDLDRCPQCNQPIEIYSD